MQIFREKFECPEKQNNKKCSLYKRNCLSKFFYVVSNNLINKDINLDNTISNEKFYQENNLSSNFHFYSSSTEDSLSIIDVKNQKTPKRKSLFYNEEENDLNSILDDIYKKIHKSIVKYLRDIQEITEKYYLLTISSIKDKLDRFCEIYRKKTDENFILENNLKEEINLLKLKIKVRLYKI